MTDPHQTAPAQSPWNSQPPVTGPLALDEPSPWETNPANAFEQPSTSWQPPSVPLSERPAVGDPSPDTPPNRRTRPVILSVVAVLAIVGAAIGGLLVGYDKGVAAGDDRYAPTVAELATIKSSQAAQAAKDADVPDLAVIAAKNFDAGDYSGDASAVEITILDGEVSSKAAGLVDYLDELGFSSAVADRMSKTRALDGTLTAEGHNCNVSWTYHPDHGLQMVFEAGNNG